MNKQHNNKIATDKYIKEKKLLTMRYSNFSFYVMKISYDLSSPIFQHLIFVEWAIEIYINKSDVNVNFFCFFGHNTM